MKLSVYVLGREVAALESVGDFKSVLTYLPGTAPEDFVSLTMPVRTESYVWDDQLPPVFQMNLPEGYLLQVLQEQFGPQIGASPTALLSVIGRNMWAGFRSQPPARCWRSLPIRLKWPSFSRATTRSRPSRNSFANTPPAVCLAFCPSFLT